jgi:hypothetical protein
MLLRPLKLGILRTPEVGAMREFRAYGSVRGRSVMGIRDLCRDWSLGRAGLGGWADANPALTPSAPGQRLHRESKILRQHKIPQI